MEHKPPSSIYLPALHPHFHHNTPKILGLCLDKNVSHEIYELLSLGVTSYLTYISSWKNCRCYFGEVTEITQLFGGKPTPSDPRASCFSAPTPNTHRPDWLGWKQAGEWERAARKAPSIGWVSVSVPLCWLLRDVKKFKNRCSATKEKKREKEDHQNLKLLRWKRYHPESEDDPQDGRKYLRIISDEVEYIKTLTTQ